MLTRQFATPTSTMLARIFKSKNTIPLAIGTTAIAASFWYSTAIRNDTLKTFNGDDKWIDLKIAKIEDESHDTRRFTFALPSEDHVTGLHTASALLAKFVTPKGSNVVRPYTPVSDISEKGHFQLVIKHYNNGKMTEHLFGLKPDDTVSFKGPILKWRWVPNSFDTITLLGAGSGITPLFQLVHHIAQNPDDKTKINLLYGNKTSGDILLRKELDEIQAKYPDQVKITYFVDQPDDSFKGEKGFITKEFLQSHIPKPTEKAQIFVCGPPPFMDAYSGNKKSPSDQGDLTGILSEMGYTKDQVFKF